MRLPRLNELAAWRASSDYAADALIDAYVEWRKECAFVHAAYLLWSHSNASGRQFAFHVYLAALEQEEHAASVYERCIELARAAHS
jgi:hypothetical protein